MANSKRFWKGMFIGALTGGALSLLDKETREAVKENWQKTVNVTSKLIQNPGEVRDQLKEAAQKVRTTVEQVGEDLSFIAEKVEELRETTPQVTQMLKETKETFAKKDEEPETANNCQAI